MAESSVELYAKVSSNLADTLVKLHHAGGLSLVFLFIGIGLVVGANIGGAYQMVTLSLGTILLLCSFCIFAFLHLKGPVRAIRTLRENEQTIDSLQELGIELTGVANTAQAFALRYATELASIVDRALPILLMIPGIGSKVRELQLDRIGNLTRSIVEATASAEVIISDTKTALTTANFSTLRQYTVKLKGARQSLREATSGVDAALRQAAPDAATAERGKNMGDV